MGLHRLRWLTLFAVLFVLGSPILAADNAEKKTADPPNPKTAVLPQ
jgi:hypothetical protein